MSEHLTAARAALADEIREATELLTVAQTRIDRANAAVAAMYGDDAPAPAVPLVRPPAPSVPDPTVQMPKRETRPAPTERRPAATRRAPSAKYDYAAVAAVARNAAAADENVNGAVMAAFNVPKQAAYQLVSTARKLGHHVPDGNKLRYAARATPPPAPAAPLPAVLVEAPAPVAPPATSGPTVLMCDECEFEVDHRPGAAGDMSQHTIKAHRRGPRVSERTPMPKGAAA